MPGAGVGLNTMAGSLAPTNSWSAGEISRKPPLAPSRISCRRSRKPGCIQHNHARQHRHHLPGGVAYRRRHDQDRRAVGASALRSAHHRLHRPAARPGTSRNLHKPAGRARPPRILRQQAVAVRRQHQQAAIKQGIQALAFGHPRRQILGLLQQRRRQRGNQFADQRPARLDAVVDIARDISRDRQLLRRRLSRSSPCANGSATSKRNKTPTRQALRRAR